MTALAAWQVPSVKPLCLIITAKIAAGITRIATTTGGVRA